MIDSINRVISRASLEEDLAHTEWLSDVSPDQLEGIYREYSAHYTKAKSQIEDLIGPPSYRLPEDRTWFGQWYPEAFAASTWVFGDRIICLAAEHQDREAPVVLAIRSYTHEEIADLSKE